MKGKVLVFLMSGFLIFATGVSLAWAKTGSGASQGAGKEQPEQAQYPVSFADRVKALKALIRDVDTKPARQTMEEIEESQDPELDLVMREAMAKTYADIVRDEKVLDQKKKEWLYSMVGINMAYLQFGGQQDSSANGLNRLIRQKLKDYLPSGALEQLQAQQYIEDISPARR